MGQVPTERVTPDLVFDRVGVDYAGPLQLKLGSTRKPVIVKSYVCVFVSLSVRAVHLELVSDLSTDAFIACLRRFISQRGKPTLLWSDHGTNFVGAASEIKEVVKFLESQKAQGEISLFCSVQNIQWRFIPEHAPHFSGLWEAAVKSFKSHLRRVVGNVKLTFEELTMVLSQIEACLNSRPLVALPLADDGVEALTPGHLWDDHWKHCQIQHLHIDPSRSSPVGTCVKHSFITSGNVGQLTIWTASSALLSGTIHRGTCALVTLSFSEKTT